MTILYKKGDTGGPVSAVAQGGLAALLKACLVDGYTGHAAAGWSYALIGTVYHAFTQAAKPGRPGRTFMLIESTNEFCSAWCCTSYSGSPTPTMVDQFAGGPSYYAFLPKVDDVSDPTADWFVLANDRTFTIGLHRGGIGGWTLPTFGDPDIPDALASDADFMSHCITSATNSSIVNLYHENANGYTYMLRTHPLYASVPATAGVVTVAANTLFDSEPYPSLGYGTAETAGKPILLQPLVITSSSHYRGKVPWRLRMLGLTMDTLPRDTWASGELLTIDGRTYKYCPDSFANPATVTRRWGAQFVEMDNFTY